MQDQFRRSTSSQFSDEVRQMRDQAQELDQRQSRIGDQIRQQVDSGRKTLRDSGDNSNLADQLDQQKERAQYLMDQMKEVSDKAEAAEPLLSRTLYDTLRKANTENLDRSLDVARELLSRNFLNQAQEIERQAGQAIQDLRKGVEEAARDVLGDETEALRLARQQLDDLIRQVNDEAARAGRTGQSPQGDANQPPSSTANEQASSSQPQSPGGDSRQQRLAGTRSAGGRARMGRPRIRPRTARGLRPAPAPAGP
jgi:DNA repair exonuclease SbcCD ATPase subunit